MCETKRPSDEALTTDLKIQWEDHWDMRTQMWRTIQVSAALVVALVGASKLGPYWFAGAVGVLLIAASGVGVLIVRHLRRCQEKKFAIILRIEEELGLFEKIYSTDDDQTPRPPKGNTVYPRVAVRLPGSGGGLSGYISTPNLIEALHCLVAIGAIIFLVGVQAGARGGHRFHTLRGEAFDRHSRRHEEHVGFMRDRDDRTERDGPRHPRQERRRSPRY